ncbi:hypothetical protein D1F64_04500 [Breoghania sp. L-A4]|nr:hypothetical protein D1F64_04500 [Breoghania sp. L-A4]
MSGGQDGFYGNGSEAPDVAAVKRVMTGIGLMDPQAQPIDYKPRAPLAVPPSTTTLPDPQADVANAENLPANWPRNKDAELLALQRSRQATGGEALREANRGPDRLSVEELQAGTRASSRPARTAEQQKAAIQGMKDNPNNRLTPTQLRTQKLIKPETASLLGPDGKPTRRYLVEPPIEYSTPADSAPLALPKVVEGPKKHWMDERKDSGPK